jgi:hypothetical protein
MNQDNTTLQTSEQINSNDTSTQPNYDNDLMTERIQSSMDEYEDSHNLTDEYCKKHPDLAPFKDAIIHEAMLALLETHKNDDEIDDRKAVELGIERFQQKLKAFLSASQRKESERAYQQNLLKINPAYSKPSNKNQSVSQILKEIGDNDALFLQYKANFLKNKGIGS